MIDSFKCIKNLGQFKAVHDVKLAKNTLIFGENGRGKTMLSEALRSLATGQPDLVAGRARLGADGGDPVVVFCQSGEGKDLVWTRAGWSDGKPQMAVFNDGFVEANVYSGLEVSASQLQGLHSVAVGEDGVQKAQSYRKSGSDVTAARDTKDGIAKAIQNRIGNEFKAEDFVGWEPCPDIDTRIAKNQAALKVALNADQIRQRSKLKPLPTPRPDLDMIRNTLTSSIDDMTTDVSRKVQTHLSKLWDSAESWVNTGWSNAGSHDTCPYCGQSLANSQLVDLFKHYFGDRYQDAKNEIARVLNGFNSDNGESARLAFMAVANENSQLLGQWKSDGLKVPHTTAFDAEAFIGAWQELTAAIIEALKKKLGAPMDSFDFDQGSRESMVRFERSVSLIEDENSEIAAVNTKIDRVKAESERGDIEVLRQEKRKLQCLKLRGEPEIAQLCSDYESARTAWDDARNVRDTRRKDMSEHNESAFHRYGAAINRHLDRFNVGFRVGEFKGASPGGVVTSEFVIVINGKDVKLRSTDQSASFRNTLSGGDRAALALAFFFASLDEHPNLEDTVVVIDDPFSSLDAGRRERTVNAIGRYETKVGQLVLMSHDASFLCQVFRKISDRTQVAGFSVDYGGEHSTIGEWKPEDACRQDAEVRLRRMHQFVAGEARATGQLYLDIRQHIEDYLTQAFPNEFTARLGIGGFLRNHETNNAQSAASPLMSSERFVELRELHEYISPRLHSDDVPKSAENELRSFVLQALDFTRPEIPSEHD